MKFQITIRALAMALVPCIVFLLLTPTVAFSKQEMKAKHTDKITNIAQPDGQVAISLKGLGYEDGISFEGAATGHEAKLAYSVPRDTPISSASIHLRYTTSPLLNKLANVLLLVNGYPLKQVSLTDEKYSSEFKVDIPVNLLRPGTLDITLKAALLVSDDRCLDSRINSALLHIEADSMLTIGYQGGIASLRDAWLLLPEKVLLTVPNRPFSEDEYNATWEIMDHLYRQGKEISITHYPKIGHIVIGDRSHLKEQLQLELQSSSFAQKDLSQLKVLDDNNAIELINSPLRSVISITNPADISISALMSDTWQKLIAGRQYQTFTAGLSDKPNNFDLDNARAIKLADLGMDTSIRYVRTNTEWNLLLDPFRMPAGTRPSRLFVDLIAPPPPNKAIFSLYAYLNGIMVHAQQLDGGSDVQHLQIPLPSRYQQLYNDIRIQIMYAEASGDCQQELPAFPVQVLPESTLIVEKNRISPERFVDLPAYLADQFDFYLPSAYLDNPVQSLPFIAAFTARYPVPFDNRQAIFVKPDSSPLSPARPFIALGNVEFSELKAQVSYDRGVIEILDRKGESLLTVDELSKISIAQLVTSKGQHGLWLRSGDGDPYPDVRRLFLNEGDVAFADQSGLLFSLNSVEENLARVHYPAARDWLTIANENRFWIMAFFWLLLVLAIVYLFRRTRQHQNNKQG